MKTDIIKYYLLPGSALCKLCNPIHEYIALQKEITSYI